MLERNLQFQDNWEKSAGEDCVIQKASKIY